MTTWICATCSVEQPCEPEPDVLCPICADERQYVPRSGQRWTTIEQLRADGHAIDFVELEPNLIGMRVRPSLGIGQQAKLVIHPEGNLLWDPVGYIDEDAVNRVRSFGPVAAVAASHPHMFGVQVEWAHALDAQILVCEADRDWVQRDDERVKFWSDSIEIVDGIALHQIGGHFRGSAVAHWRHGADRKGVLLAGDTITANPDGTASFMRSYPNKIPLSAAVVDRIATEVCKLLFDRLYNNFSEVIAEDANHMVRWSADRYMSWIFGDYDHLT